MYISGLRLLPHKPRRIHRQGKLRQRAVQRHRRESDTHCDHLDMYADTGCEARYTAARALFDLLAALIIVGEVEVDHLLDIQLGTDDQVAKELIRRRTGLAGPDRVSKEAAGLYIRRIIVPDIPALQVVEGQVKPHREALKLHREARLQIKGYRLTHTAAIAVGRELAADIFGYDAGYDAMRRVIDRDTHISRHTERMIATIPGADDLQVQPCGEDPAKVIAATAVEVKFIRRDIRFEHIARIIGLRYRAVVDILHTHTIGTPLAKVLHEAGIAIVHTARIGHGAKRCLPRHQRIERGRIGQLGSRIVVYRGDIGLAEGRSAPGGSQPEKVIDRSPAYLRIGAGGTGDQY